MLPPGEAIRRKTSAVGLPIENQLCSFLFVSTETQIGNASWAFVAPFSHPSASYAVRILADNIILSVVKSIYKLLL